MNRYEFIYHFNRIFAVVNAMTTIGLIAFVGLVGFNALSAFIIGICGIGSIIGFKTSDNWLMKAHSKYVKDANKLKKEKSQ